MTSIEKDLHISFLEEELLYIADMLRSERNNNKKYIKSLKAKNESLKQQLESQKIELKNDAERLKVKYNEKVFREFKANIKSRFYSLPLKREAIDTAERITSSKYFDAEWYEETYSLDLDTNAIAHYLKHEKTLEVNPSSKFSVSKYVEKYPDVANSSISPLLHFLKYGLAEKRRIYKV